MTKPATVYIRTHVPDQHEAVRCLIALIKSTKEDGNMRFIRHITHLKIKLDSPKGDGDFMLSEKQVATLKHAMEKYG